MVKVERLERDTIRGLVPFPEAGGATVMQGKESLALDMRAPEGLAIVHEWKAADIQHPMRAAEPGRRGGHTGRHRRASEIFDQPPDQRTHAGQLPRHTGVQNVVNLVRYIQACKEVAEPAATHPPPARG
ncbi:hypothetical protein C5E45_19445 [Nocardia nova]|uniref:Uncharacterized protein n=1 Tax=Nocardia nova TaxID=37330 RepID=A0A2S6AMZ1_9NOCA|nr:hypothetical protein [Nocardia nova]PPJ36590.1 hypothetical protein C5E45_19445 [Nocardia nova]